MIEQWSTGAPGVVEFPSGVRVRGRGLRSAAPDGPAPTLAVHLTGRITHPPYERLWVKWPDFWVPSDPAQAVRVLRLAHHRAVGERVELACGGGVGRTGTGLAMFAIFEGMNADDAVLFVRTGYHPDAVEMPWQRRFLRRVARGDVAA